MLVAVQSGLLRSMVVSKDKVIDLIPVDMVVNTMIVSAWKRGSVETESKFINEIPLTIQEEERPWIPIYHCTSGATKPITWRQIENEMIIPVRKYPLDGDANMW